MRDEPKTRNQFIAELEALRAENADLRQHVERRSAMERVRDEAMAMRSSADILKVVAIFYQAMRDLGVKTTSVSIQFVDEYTHALRRYVAFDNPRKYNIGWTSPDLLEFNESIAVWSAKGMAQSSPAADMAFIDQWRAGEVWTVTYAGEEWAEILKNARSGLGLDRFLPVPMVAEWIVVNVPFEFGTLGFHEPTFSEDHTATVQELTDPLSLGYLRCLEFQRLEEQAERLRVDRAIERVRAEAMAMRQIDDLEEVLVVTRQCMEELGIPFHGCSLNVVVDAADPPAIMLHQMNKSGPGWRNLGSKEAGNLIAQFRQEGLPVYRRDLDEEDIYGERRWMTRQMGSVHSILDLPFSHGTLAVNSREPKAFSERDISILQHLAEVLSLGYLRFIDFQQVDEARSELIDELEKELQTAHDLQQGLMPTEPPQIEGFDISGRCIPANHVGGDFFQYFPQNGKLAICMADVTGHAMEAAVPLMMFSGILESEVKHDYGLGDLFSSLNQILHKKLVSRTYVCFCMGELDIADHTFRLANAACPYPFHFCAATSHVEELEVNAYPLGARAASLYTTVETTLESGDRIVFCSDGIIEAANAVKEIFGFERTATTIQQGCQEDLSAEMLIEYLTSVVQDFTGDVPQRDDMTYIVVRVE